MGRQQSRVSRAFLKLAAASRNEIRMARLTAARFAPSLYRSLEGEPTPLGPPEVLESIQAEYPQPDLCEVKQYLSSLRDQVSSLEDAETAKGEEMEMLRQEVIRLHEQLNTLRAQAEDLQNSF
ncbi:hypothetical protein NDU88_004761 [Pleurodeles waltl]|uniref:Uncharacterized protein n=1 Tax=Pleurodeles waltl TaxID=8319 RepID=A0AAV7LL17_PLEWA|nr:hypothetical protein NDU88_004761 [Pleurodeles waltl]